MKCPYCKSSVARDALVCAKCTRDLRTDDAKGLIAEQAARDKKAANGGLIAVVVMLLLMGGCFVLLNEQATRDSNTEAARISSSIESNIGRTACNATNGVYIGKVIGGYTKTTPNGEVWVYGLNYEGTTREAPVDNVTFPGSSGKCADGRPE